MTAAKRATSVMLSAVMLMSSLLTPMTVYAQEAVTEGNEATERQVEEETTREPVPEETVKEQAEEKEGPEQKETETPDYQVRLPSYKEAAWMVDEDHVKDRKEEETVLTYKAGDKVKLSFAEQEGFELEEIKVVDGSANEQEFTWESEYTLVFLMPEKDLEVTAAFHEIPKETDLAVSDGPATVEDESIPPAVSEEYNEVGHTELSVEEESAEDIEEITSPEPDQGYEANSSDEGTAAASENETKELQIPAIDPETEADGFPVGGSIVRLGEVAISSESTGYETAAAFEDAPYPQDTCRYEMKSSTIQYGTPGLYEMIFRVDENTTGRFWYVVRPVRVAEEAVEAIEADKSSDTSEDHGNDEEVSDDEDSSHPDMKEEETESETITEAEESSEKEDPDWKALTETVEEEGFETEAVSEAETEKDDVQVTETAWEEPEENDRLYNILFGSGEGYTITMDHDQVTYQEGDEVAFTVKAEEKYAIRTAAAHVALSGKESAGEGSSVAEEALPVIITPEEVELSRTNSVVEGDETVEASFEFEMPAEDVVLEASMVRAASASNDVEVNLVNGKVKNVPRTWIPDGMAWAYGTTAIGYTVYRTVTMPDGEERKAYCMQPSGAAAGDGTYTATEVKKKGKLSAEEALTIRKAVFYSYGGPGWNTGEVKNILTDCTSNDEYYVASHFILAKIYGEATGLPNWNVAFSGETTYTAMNDRGKAQIEAAVAKIKSLPDPGAGLSPTQAAGVYNEATGFAETQAVTYESNVAGNDLSATLPSGVYLTVGKTTYEPGQKAVIPPGSTFILKKKGFEAAHQETISFKAAIFTDFDAYMINTSSEYQDMGFSYVADKELKLTVNWPDRLTHINVVKTDSVTGNGTPKQNYSLDGAVYGIYEDAKKTKLLEQLTISKGKAVSSENYVPGKTYYVAEISAPAVYRIDQKVYPVMAEAGGTAVVTSKDEPKTIRISVQKVDKETGKSSPQAKGLSFKDAVFGIYSDENCTKKAVDINGKAVPDMRTDAKGHAESAGTLPIADYYVKEISAPAGYLANNEVFTVTARQVRDEIVNGDANAALVCEEQIIRANMDLMKVQTLKDKTTRAAKGVQFTFTYVSDPTVTFSVIDGMNNTVITDEEGHATTQSDKYPNGTLIYGEWEITESNTPEGFETLEPTRFMIAGDGRTYRFVANNHQICAALLIEKRDANTGSLIPVEGVKFRLLKDGEPVKLFNPSARAYEDTWVTNADGMVQLPELVEYGTYVMKEDPESIPEGYFAMEDKTFTVDRMANDYTKPLILTASEPPQMGNITVEKRDAKTDETLEGFSFEISAAEDITDPAGVIRTGTNADGEEVSLKAGTVVDRLVTGEDGSAVSKDLFTGSYTIRETGIRNGYAITKETQNVTIKGDAEKAANKENVSEYILFKNEPAALKLLKVSSGTEAPIEGVSFLVHKLQDGETVDDYAWNGEEESPDGRIDAVSGSMQEKENAGETAKDAGKAGSDAEGGNADDETSEESQEEESAAEENSQSSGLDESLFNEDEIYVTDANGEIRVEYLEAGSTYVIREIKAAPGYNLSHELVSFSVDNEGLIEGSSTKEVTMKNEPNRVRISKVDITNSEEIPGAQLTITDSEGNVAAEWTSTYEVHEIDALPAGTYTLTEVTAPKGYEKAESVTFTVINSRKIQTVVMEDAPCREVEISKTDITGDKELAGAHLTITDKDGNELESWVSTAQVHTVRLHSGEYILTETKPADGYATAESVPFTVIRTSADDYDVMGVTMKDDVTKVKITKSDITTSKPVIGAELIIKDKDGSEIAKWTTEEEPFYIEKLPIGTYTLTEITAPSGYATAETVEFTVKDTGEIQMVEMKDAPITAEISKKDIADGPGGDELPGAHLTVKNEKGEVIDDWVSGKKPHKISMLPVGKYTLTEVTAPKGYEVAETIEFEIKDSGEVHKVTMYDSPKEETVDLTGKKKTTTTGGTYTPGTTGVTSVVTPPVQTGDDTPILLFVLLGVLAVMTGSLALYLKKKGRIV